MGSFTCAIFGHKWSEWHYLEEENCDQEHACQRCHEKDIRRDIHDYEARYLEDGECTKTLVCKRCGAKGHTEVTHDIGDVRVKCGTVKTCTRCGAQIPQDHEYGERKVDQSGPMPVITRICMNCGYIARKVMPYGWKPED